MADEENVEILQNSTSTEGQFLLLLNETTTELLNSTLATTTSSTTTSSTTTTSSPLIETTFSTNIPEHQHEESMEKVINSLVANVSEPSTLEHLIESLKTRLIGMNATTSPRLNSTSLDDFIFNNNLPHATNHSSVEGKYPHDDRILHADTIILVVSCVIMIILGLVLRKAFVFFSKGRKARMKYHDGLKQMAEHMHVVTKTMSYDISEGPSSSHKTPARRAYSVNDAETRFDVFKPSVRELTRKESVVGEYLTQLESRRLSKMHNFLVNYEK